MYISYMNEFDACPTDGTLGLLTLLIRSGRFAESKLDQSLQSAGLTFVKWRMLDALVNAKAPVSLGKLAEHLNCVKSNVTQLTDRLESEGIVRRVTDPEDRRSTLMELTEAGKSMHGDGREALESTTKELFASSDESERDTLRKLLGVLSGEKARR